MNKLQQLIKNPNYRFKTSVELAYEFGPNYTECIPHMEPLDLLAILSLFGGKKFYLSLIRNYPKWWIQTDNTRTFLRYGPTASLVHVSLLTTKAFPKWSSRADILKPGMLVTIEYGEMAGKAIVISSLRNVPGTTTRILSVVKPSKYFRDTRIAKMFPHVDDYGVAVELINPAVSDSVNNVKNCFGRIFKDHKVIGFEISWQVRKATEIERKFYYSQIRG